jgi:hypothetical protein
MPTDLGAYWMPPSYGNAGNSCYHGTLSGATCWSCRYPSHATSPAQLTFTLGGWACPGCGRCHSPSLLTCPWCGPDATTADGSTPGDECVPASEGGLCVPGSEPGRCTGGRHCSC